MKNSILIALLLALNSMPANASVLSPFKGAARGTLNVLEKAGAVTGRFVVKELKQVPDIIATAVITAEIEAELLPIVLTHLVI